MPRWHGFRRAVALGVQRERGAAATAQGCLRHSNVQTTLAHYTKTVRLDVRQALEKRAKVIKPEIQGQRPDLSTVAGAQLKLLTNLIRWRYVAPLNARRRRCTKILSISIREKEL
jgi:hypothetical protein